MINGVFYTITAEVDPAAEAEWLGWYQRVHAREVLAQPGFLRATLYRVEVNPDEWSKYVAMYEVESREALAAYLGGDEVVRLRVDFQSRYGNVTRLSRQILFPHRVIE